LRSSSARTSSRRRSGRLQSGRRTPVSSRRRGGGSRLRVPSNSALGTPGPYNITNTHATHEPLLSAPFLGFCRHVRTLVSLQQNCVASLNGLCFDRSTSYSSSKMPAQTCSIAFRQQRYISTRYGHSIRASQIPRLAWAPR
jgi:hypothetical protein